MKEQEGVCWEIISYAPDHQEVCLSGRRVRGGPSLGRGG